MGFEIAISNTLIIWRVPDEELSAETFKFVYWIRTVGIRIFFAIFIALVRNGIPGENMCWMAKASLLGTCTRCMKE